MHNELSTLSLPHHSPKNALESLLKDNFPDHDNNVEESKEQCKDFKPCANLKLKKKRKKNVIKINSNMTFLVGFQSKRQLNMIFMTYIASIQVLMV